MGRHYRRIHIDGKEWSYVPYGHGNGVIIRKPDGGNVEVPVSALPGNEGWNPDLVERARRKGNRLPSITPAAIKYHIETAILGRTLPPYVEKPQEDARKRDEFQERRNAKHWARARHDTLRYRFDVGYPDDEKIFREDGPIVERKDAVPVDVIRETLGRLDKPFQVAMFILEPNAGGSPFGQATLVIHPRPESDGYAIFDRHEAYAELVSAIRP